MGRGGPRHQSKPWVDVGLLYKCLEKHKAIVKDLGAYEHISSSAAPNPLSLVDTKPLWEGLVRLEPSGMVHAQPLRQSLLSLLAEEPDLNVGKHSGSVWCNLKVERITTILTHVRKLAREPLWLESSPGSNTHASSVA